MFRHNLKLALRNQVKNKVFSIINVLGLAIGISVSVLIINFVSFEFSFDNMHTKSDHIYRVENRFYEGDILTDDWATSSFGYGSAISREMTGVENYVRIGAQNSEQTVSYKEIRSRENGIAFTGLAFFISLLGLWGLASFTASKKVKDVGVRKIFGARTGSIVYLFSREIVGLILIALLIATPVSILIMKNWLLNFAFRITVPYWIYLAGGIITLSIAMITVGWQSWKAATRNPVETLRYE